MTNIKDSFNSHAKNYDEERTKLIPCFKKFYSTAVELVQIHEEPLTILDLGAGTGLLTSMLLERYPTAHYTLIDLSEKMLNVAKKRFEGNNNITYKVADYTTVEGQNQYDVVVSSLSIHHLSDDQKEKLYHNVFNSLKSGGIFVNADQVLGETDNLNQQYKQNWQQRIENTNLTTEQLQAAYERTKLDQMSTLSQQLNWLKAAGFVDVDCVFKEYSFAVLFGKKNKECSLN
ncbi:class I SAM-dependent methyltransferase [Bacillus solimangrovi]|uniref:Methyltransferase n=1 Tax=Bacillus solimangrovi TaxID=1305675 RepID=A0A1E5LHN4_9BACI|nr:class I SAM-dependent methyltransferase [Bacillus solimangrovi]OEH93593.1 methyltransferase [Bacillus solimangrovi]